ncbi:Nucleoside phosphorylase domain protein, partial [Metarhizium majus ARSEF 297]
MKRLRPENYTVGWLCALPTELDAATKMFDERHCDILRKPHDPNLYTLGRIHNHNVVIVCLPAGQTGASSAAAVMGQMRCQFPSIQHTFLVGVGGGVPGDDAAVRLGDVVISQPHMGHGGVVQYDFGKSTPSGFIRTGFVNAPPTILLNAVNKLRANILKHQVSISNNLSTFSHLRDSAGPDVLFESTYEHVGGASCDSCDKDLVTHGTPRSSEDIVVHYGTIASGNQLIRDGITRDTLSSQLGGVLCFEMEAAGFMRIFPGLVIRGICDYADSHKNKKWQAYASATAAVIAKEILSILPLTQLAAAEEADFALENSLQLLNLSKRPEWHVARAGTLTFNIFEHISDYEPNDTYCNYLHDKCPGTATWILGDEEFLAWRKKTSAFILLNAVNKLRANILEHQANISKNLSTLSRLRDSAGPDILFQSTYTHIGGASCDSCDKDLVTHGTPRSSEDIVVHYGTIASGNQLIRDGITRDTLSSQLGGVLCFEMEAAGFMRIFPGLVIRGICDYADSHKNKKWQAYASATAAVIAKEILSILPLTQLAAAEEADFALENSLQLLNLSKRPEWHVARAGKSRHQCPEELWFV